MNYNMEEYDSGSLYRVEEDSGDNSSEKEDAPKNKEKPKEDTQMTREESSSVLYPRAPKVKLQSDDQVDVTVSPAFQTLDQVGNMLLTQLRSLHSSLDFKKENKIFIYMLQSITTPDCNSRDMICLKVTEQ